jgi:hypothetical protein
MTRTTPRLLCCLLLVVLTIASAHDVLAAALNPGDLVVLNSPFGANRGSLVRVNPQTGSQSLITGLPGMESPGFIQYDGGGGVYLIDQGHDASEIFHVDLSTGTQTPVSSGGLLQRAIGMSIDGAGNLIVVQRGAENEIYGMLKINPTNGQQTSILANQPFPALSSVVAEDDGNYLLANESQFGPPGTLLRLDPLTGDLSLVAELDTGSLSMRPSALSDNEVLLVSFVTQDEARDAYFQVLDESGWSVDGRWGPPLWYPIDSAQDAQGAYYILDSLTGIVKAHGFSTSVLTSDGLLTRPFGLVVYVPEPSTFLLAIPAAAYVWALRRGKRRSAT